MKRLMLILPLIAMAGCSSNVALKDDSNTTQAVGTLTLTWLQPNSMEVMLDGKRYVANGIASVVWTRNAVVPIAPCPKSIDGISGKVKLS